MRIQNKKRLVTMIGMVVLSLVVLISSTIFVIGKIIPEDEAVEEKAQLEEEIENKEDEASSQLDEIMSAEAQTEERQDSVEQEETAQEEETEEKAQTGNITSQAVVDPSDTLVLVNKKHSLSADYVPSDLVWVDLPGVRDTQLRSQAASALEGLFEGALNNGLYLYCCSGYRSYSLQEELYEQNVNALGQAEADLVSAKPGCSEHQSGLAMDVTAESVGYDLLESFGETAEGQYVKENAHRYGFIVRYPQDKTYITGYAYEPWHLRYVGVEAATEMYQQGLTFEEYLDNF